MNARTRGRPPGDDGAGRTRGAILDAARELFAAKGFDRTSMREVARAAGVDAALIHHYFGTKSGLLVAALTPERDPADILAGVAESTDVGVALVRRAIGFWEENPEQRLRAIAMLRVAATDDEVAGRVREFFLSAAGRVLHDVARGDQRQRRISLVAGQMLGLVMARYVFALPEIASATPDELARQVGPVMDHYLTGDL